MKKELNPSRIYNEAAKLVEHNTSDIAVCGYSCLAIQAAVYCATGTYIDEPLELVAKYVELFYPPDELQTSWYNEDDAWGELWGNTDQERSDCRVLALLFMAEIAKGD